MSGFALKDIWEQKVPSPVLSYLESDMDSRQGFLSALQLVTVK